MPDVPKGHIVHSTPHRLRIRIPAKRRDKNFFSNMRDYFLRQAKVEGVEVNHLTASILVHTSDAGSLIESLGRDVPFILVEQASKTTESNPLEQVREQLSDWNTQLKHWTGSSHDARIYIFGTLVLGAAYQLVRGEIFAPAATLLWYAGEALRLWIPSDKGTEFQPGKSDDS